MQFRIDNPKAIITKGYQFLLVLHNLEVNCTIESIDGIFKDQEIEKKPVKVATHGQTIMCKLGLDLPIGVANHTPANPLGVILGFKDDEFIGSGTITKHVPDK